jgi:DNA repair exonuclease SbcCD ATPase subunit
MADIQAWAKAFQDRFNEKIAHTNQLVEQKLEYRQKFLEQQLATIGEINAEKLLGFSARLEEALAEIRGYKDILQQQLTLLDNSVKKVHVRVDDAYKASEAGQKALELFKEKFRRELDALKEELERQLTQIQSNIEHTTGNLTELETDLRKIQDMEREEEIVKTTRQNDPIRKFLAENGKKVLLFVLAGVGFFLLRNLHDLIAFLQMLEK